MAKKTCFKCGDTKKLSEFYRHAQMADGHLNKCKTCTRLDTGSNRSKNKDYCLEYDRKRAMRPDRVEARRSYLKTPGG